MLPPVLSLTNGAELNTSTYGQGNAGSINIQATNKFPLMVQIHLKISQWIFSQVNSGAVGNGGNINITTKSLSITNGAKLSTGIIWKGNAGSINIQATEQVSLDGTDTSAQKPVEYLAK